MKKTVKKLPVKPPYLKEAFYSKLMETKKKDKEEEEEEVEDEEIKDDEEIEDLENFYDLEGGGDKMHIYQDAETELSGISGDIQNNLEAALEGARQLGDDKLTKQIGNSLTFFTRQHVVKEVGSPRDNLNIDDTPYDNELNKSTPFINTEYPNEDFAKERERRRNREITESERLQESDFKRRMQVIAGIIK